MRGKRPSIATLSTSRTSMAAVVVIALIGVIWGWRDYGILQQSLARELDIYQSQRNAVLERTVHDAVQNIGLLRGRLEENLRQTLRGRVDQALAIAGGVCAQSPTAGDCRALASAVREALRGMRFNGGRGYFFAFDVNGVEQLFPPAPQLEGTVMTDLADDRGRVVADMLAIVKTKGEGFYRYNWLKPNANDYDHAKLAFIRLFEPLGWVIGIGEYVEDLEVDMQDEALAQLSSLRFGDTGYVFVGTWDGVSLIEPAKGRNMWEVTDKNGLKVVQTLVKVAQAGGGFVEYTMPAINGGATYPKISYVESIPAWRWYVGAGESRESIAKDLAGRRQAGQARINLEIALVGMIAILFAFAILLRGWMAAGRTRRDFRTFLDFLGKAATAETTLDPGKMAFVEFGEMAEAANRLIEDKNKALAELERQRTALDLANEELELRVQGRTRDLESEISERKYVEDELQRANEVLEQRIEESTRDLREQIAERERVENQFIQAQKMEAVGQLAGGFAHDFNNILTVIVSTLGALRTRVPADERALQAIDLAEKAAKRAADLTRRMLVFSREMDTRPEPVDLRELVSALQPLVVRALRESVEFSVKCPRPVWPVSVDPILLENAVVNIALNAQDAMTDGGRFTLRVANRRISAAEAARIPLAQAGDYVELAMDDTGTGIPAEIVERIFEPFFTTKPVGAGTGLGLSMVLTFIRRSGGFVGIDSEEGRGTTVSLFLPRSARKASSRAAGKVRGPVAGLQHLRILLVEDDPMVRDVTVGALRAQDMDVTEAADGPQAMAILETKGPFDLLVSDLIMPGGMSGLDLREQVRERWPTCRVLVMTGYSHDEFARRGVDPASIDLLRKPFSRDDLLAAIAALEPAVPS